MSELADLAPPVAEGFHLSPLGPADAEDLFAHFADPRVTEFLDVDPFTEIEQANDTIAWAAERLAAGAGVRWAIRSQPGNAFVGTCGFNAIVLQRGRRGEVAYDLSHRWWGKGVMARLMPPLIAFGFSGLALKRLEAMVTPGNDRSCALLERHGFRREGLLADHGFWKGRWHDQIVYGLTGPDPDPTL